MTPILKYKQYRKSPNGILQHRTRYTNPEGIFSGARDAKLYGETAIAVSEDTPPPLMEIEARGQRDEPRDEPRTATLNNREIVDYGSCRTPEYRRMSYSSTSSSCSSDGYSDSDSDSISFGSDGDSDSVSSISISDGDSDSISSSSGSDSSISIGSSSSDSVGSESGYSVDSHWNRASSSGIYNMRRQLDSDDDSQQTTDSWHDRLDGIACSPNLKTGVDISKQLSEITTPPISSRKIRTESSTEAASPFYGDRRPQADSSNEDDESRDDKESYRDEESPSISCEEKGINENNFALGEKLGHENLVLTDLAYAQGYACGIYLSQMVRVANHGQLVETQDADYPDACKLVHDGIVLMLDIRGRHRMQVLSVWFEDASREAFGEAPPEADCYNEKNETPDQFWERYKMERADTEAHKIGRMAHSKIEFSEKLGNSFERLYNEEKRSDYFKRMCSVMEDRSNYYKRKYNAEEKLSNELLSSINQLDALKNNYSVVSEDSSHSQKRRRRSSSSDGYVYHCSDLSL